VIVGCLNFFVFLSTHVGRLLIRSAGSPPVEATSASNNAQHFMEQTACAGAEKHQVRKKAEGFNRTPSLSKAF